MGLADFVIKLALETTGVSKGTDLPMASDGK